MLGSDEGIILGSTDGEVIGFSLGASDGIKLGIEEGTQLISLVNLFDGSNGGNFSVPCLEFALDKKLVLKLVLLIVISVEKVMEFWNKQLLDSHLVHLVDL